MIQVRRFNEDVTHTQTVAWQGLENQQNGDAPRVQQWWETFGKGVWVMWSMRLSQSDSWGTEKGKEGVGGAQTKLTSMCLPGFQILWTWAMS